MAAHSSWSRKKVDVVCRVSYVLCRSPGDREFQNCRGVVESRVGDLVERSCSRVSEGRAKTGGRLAALMPPPGEPCCFRCVLYAPIFKAASRRANKSQNRNTHTRTLHTDLHRHFGSCHTRKIISPTPAKKKRLKKYVSSHTNMLILHHDIH